MNITFNQLKTFYSALKNKMKGFRGNWNQNDPTADDYIKNRPFYSEVKEYIIIDNLSSINYSNGEYPRCNFIPNQSYDIIWNGTLYKNVVCRFDDPYHFLGGSNSNYPFYINDDGGNSLYVEGEGDWTLSILTTQELVHQINPKYVPLPEGVVNEKDLSSVAWTGSYNDLYDQPLVVRADISQSLTPQQQAIVRGNIDVPTYGAVSTAIDNRAVVYKTSQSLTDIQKKQARANIGAGTSNFSGDYNDLENKLIYSTIIKDIIYIEQNLTSSVWNPTEHNNGKDSYYAYPGIQGAFRGPKAGEICEINLSGQIFETEVKQGNTSESWWLGNQNIYDQSYDDTGESFYITMQLDIGNKYYYYLYSRTQEKITYISIIKKGYTEYHQLDENYIPDTIARVSDLQSILPEATADDNGKILGIADGEWTKVAMNEGVSQEYVDNAIAQKSQVQIITWEADD